MTLDRIFGIRHDGKTVTAHELRSEHGYKAVILNHGAILQSFSLPDSRNVTLSYDDWAGYAADNSHVGRIIGPNANRIENAEFHIQNKHYKLYANDGRHNLHSGPDGFDSQIWEVKRLASGLELTHSSPEGHNGFPGGLDLCLKISLLKNTLRLDMEAVTSKPSPVNLTWHPYWNLSGQKHIDGHDLRVASQARTENFAANPIHLKGTRFDFQRALPLGSIKLDENFVAASSATLISGQTKLHVTSSLPDMQIYTGDHLPIPRSGIAIEPQFRPNDINFNQNCLLMPKSIYRHWIEYTFETD